MFLYCILLLIKNVYSNVPRKVTNATLKKMISPVTSTNVATKGAEEEAGSAPNFFKMIGSILPINEDHKTTPTKEKQTVSPIKNQCSP